MICQIETKHKRQFAYYDLAYATNDYDAQKDHVREFLIIICSIVKEQCCQNKKCTNSKWSNLDAGHLAHIIMKGTSQGR